MQRRGDRARRRRAGSDAEALERIGAAYPGREVVGVPGGVIAFGGGGPHCITQQVPARGT